jgi:lysophospholipase
MKRFAFALSLLLAACADPAHNQPTPAQIEVAKAALTEARFQPPPSWSWGQFARPDGATLRFGHAPATGAQLGAIVFLPGFRNFAEANFEAFRQFQAAGLEVYVLDLRGQGGSSRPLKDREKPAGVSFRFYADDVADFIAAEVRPKTAGPVTLIGTSLGGQIALLTAADNPGAADRYFLAVPAIQPATAPHDPKVARAVAASLSLIGQANAYAPGVGPRDFPDAYVQATDGCAGDPVRGRAAFAWNLTQPELRLGGPTNGWLKGLFTTADRLSDPQVLQTVAAPVMMINAGRDTYVDAAAAERACQHMPQCWSRLVPEATHCIWQARDAERDIVVAQAIAFATTPLQTDAAAPQSVAPPSH